MTRKDKYLVHFEQLEPRILLSGDGLLSIAPDPLQDDLLDSTPQVVQYAELLETSEQVEERIGAELAASDTLDADICQPLFTLVVGDDDANDEGDPAQTSDDLALLPDGSDVRIGSQAITAQVVGLTAAEPTRNKSAVPTEDGSMPTQIGDVDLSIEYATSIEIRGPPADTADSPDTSYLSTYTTQDPQDVFAETSEVCGLLQFKAPDLPGLQLVDPDISSWQGQVIYLDFDGEEGVTYNGPVLVEGINIPEFSTDAAGLAGQEPAIISQILSALEQTFEGTGVLFTTTEPDPGASYSTIFIGGDDSAFFEYGSFLGLAEELDVGNRDQSDSAFVFSNVILSQHTEAHTLVVHLASIVAHEVGHLLGYAHNYSRAGRGALDDVGAAIILPPIIIPPDTPNQAIPIVVSGTELVTGLKVLAQIGDGTGPGAEPVFDGVDFTGGIWDAYPNTVTGGPVGGAERFLQASVVFNETRDEVVANGLVATLLVDTTGISEGTFDLLLAGTQIGADTAFILYGGVELPIDVTNGTITIDIDDNDPPVLASIGDRAVDEGSLLTFTATASDSDIPANALTFSLDPGAPAGVSIDPDTGVFNWTAAEDQGPGSYDVTVRVTDDGMPNLDDHETITITVDEVNVAPVLAPIGDKSVSEDSLLTFTTSATDSDIPANVLTFSLDPGAPVGTVIDPSTGVFTWTPDEDQAPGPYAMTVRVTDDGTPNLDDEETITITVTDAVRTLTISSTSGGTVTDPGEGPFLYDDGTVVSIHATAVDNYHFVNWTGDLSGSSNPATIIMDSDKSVTANFAVDQHTLTISSTSGGTVADPGEGDFQYDHGTDVSIQATAGGGNYFVNWTGTAATAGKVTNPNAAGTTVTVDAAYTIQANFGESDGIAPTVTIRSPAANSIQAPLNSLIILHVTDGGLGVAAGSVTITLDGDTIYMGDTSEYSSAMGICRRVGTPADYTYAYQSNQPFDFDETKTVTVDAADLGGIAMTQVSYSFTTEMRSFGQNKQVSSGLDNLNSSRPATVCDSSGNIWAVWHAGPAGSRNIYVAKLAAGADAFGASIQIRSNSSDQANPAIALGTDDELYVVWQDNREGDWDIYGSTSTNGTTWSVEQRLVDANDNYNQTNPALVVDSQSPNRAHVVWQEGGAGNRNIYIATSGDGFVTRTVSQITSDPADQTAPAIAVDSSNTVYVLWTDARNATNDIYGASGSPWTNAPVVTKAADQSSPAIAVESSGSNLHMLWVDKTPGDSDIYYASSNGLPPSPLTGSSLMDPGETAEQFSPAIAVTGSSGNGLEVFACWHDERDADTDLYMVQANPVAGTNLFVGDGGTNSDQTEPAMGLDQYGYPYIVWTDNRGSNTGIYYAGSHYVQTSVLASELITASSGGTVGTDPGSITDVDDASIAIPSGACPYDVTISITKIENPHAYSLPVLNGYDFSPSGLEFNSPVTITIPYAATGAAGTPMAYWYDSLTGALSQQGITDIEIVVLSSTLHALRFKTLHFMPFYVLLRVDAPVVDAGPDKTVNEGSLASLDPATFTDPDTGDTHTAVIDWGDGTAAEAGTVDQDTHTVSGNHVYADNGAYTVMVTVTDNKGVSGSDTLTVTVSNVAPTTVYTIIGDFCGPNFGPPDGYVDVWDLMELADHWHTSTGDPDSDPRFDLAGPGFGNLDGYVDVWDLMGFADHWHLEAGSDKTVEEGQTLSLDAAAFNDQGTLDTHTATIDWGDGTVPDVGVVTQTPFGPPGSASGADGAVSGSQHVYADDGVYTVTVTVTDDEGLSGSDTLTVTVNDVVATAGLGLDSLALRSLGPASIIDDEESVIGVTVSNDYAPEMQPDGTVYLPGMQLVDPDISNWQGQIIYLDFDGAKDVIYNGPVAVGPFDMPAFALEGTELAGQEPVIIDQIIANIQDIFAGSGVIFTTERPPAETRYSTIYIGGDDSAFAAYGSFLGLAEQVDESNQDPTDDAFVFSDVCTSGYADVESLADTLAGLIAHETGHLLGFVHNDLTQSSTLGKLALEIS